MEPSYRLFFDESGDRTKPDPDVPSTLYLALCGCAFSKGEYEKFAAHVDQLKDKHFMREAWYAPVIFHLEDIREKRGAFAVLKEDSKRAAFDADILDLFARFQYFLIVVVIDKKTFRDRCGEQADPYSRCLWVLLEEYCELLTSTGERGDVLGEARDQGLDRETKRAYEAYFQNHPQTPLTSREIKLKPKELNFQGVQLADMLAYPTKANVLLSNSQITGIGNFSRRVCDQLNPKSLRQRFLLE